MPRRQYENAHARRLAADRRRREREGWTAKPKPAPPPKPLTPSEAVSLFRREKAASEARNAGRQTAVMAAVERALARADEERAESRKGGRPARLKLALHSDPANALVNALNQWDR